ncbi:hypothetical protein [Paraburkholderia tuberum]|uniref:Prophage minor tail protein Z (GPZ) n=1 Tax=Paraburkholderia tuberum TaxID=157910 RepID=A0A1H1JS76_9BURK|nr:hypothetical protein [Paraburkholderia tuberum]SDR52853.1 hypothetical protein SAMN05445850_5558 [Paraburkholderia tuberum]
MGVIQVNVRGDFEKLPLKLRMFARDLPFAVSLALNDTAFDARKTIQGETLPQTFTLRNRRTQSGTKVDKASKQSLTATIGTVDWWTAEQVSGAKRAAGNEGRESVMVQGRPYLAIPAIHNAPSKVVTKSQRASALIAKNKAFVVRLRKSGQLAVVRREGGERYPLKVLFILKPVVQQKKRFELEAAVADEVRRRFGARLQKRLADVARKAGAT